MESYRIGSMKSLQHVLTSKLYTCISPEPSSVTGRYLANTCRFCTDISLKSMNLARLRYRPGAESSRVGATSVKERSMDGPIKA